MLWMKAWLETRWRLLYVLGLPLAGLALRCMDGIHSSGDAQRLTAWLSFFAVFSPVYLAGAGIRTQSGLQATKGIHGSMYYTLALPVTRLRLLVVRAACGFLEAAAVDVIVLGMAWLCVPAVRMFSVVDLLQLILATIICTACFFFLSVLLATFLSESWQIWGSLALVCFMWELSSYTSLPASTNVFRFATDASPLLTHTLPWPAMTISLAISSVLFFAAWRVVKAREY